MTTATDVSERSSMVPVPDWVARFYAAVDSLRARRWDPFLSPNATLRFANGAPTRGSWAIQDRIGAFNERWLRAMRHDFVAVWVHVDATVVEAEVAYERLDGARFTYPCVTVLRTDDAGRIHDMRVFIDVSTLVESPTSRV